MGCGTGVLTRLAAAENSQVMLCVNPDMGRDTTEILLVLGMKKNRRRDPEQISVERCW
jgi:ferredoxin--NADP+ reductase